MGKAFVHPYLPNSVPEIRRAMLKEIGVKHISDIYRSIIPANLIYEKELNLPEPILSEYELKKHVMNLLEKNKDTEEYCNFLGAGCYKHQVPAICDELNNRGEFLTAYCGDTYSDHGKMQAIFEYASMMGELLDLDVVSYTSYDGGQAVASSLSTALRVQKAAGKKNKTMLLVPETMNPEIYSQIREYLRGSADIRKVAYRKDSGGMDLHELQRFLDTGKAAAVFYENPSYLGFYELKGEKIAAMAHAAGALVIVQPELASLGIMESPANYGADIVCGDIQPLGMHMQFGGGQGGFMACRQEVKLLQQFPTYFYGIAKTNQEGVYGWGRAMNDRCSHGSREKANEYFGTETGLWCITAGIYLASMGPQGMYDLGKMIVQNLAYLCYKLNLVLGVNVKVFNKPSFQEVLVNFDETGMTVAEINHALLKHRIFGGKDMSQAFPELGQTALYCVSELTTVKEIDKLAVMLQRILRRQA